MAAFKRVAEVLGGGLKSRMIPSTHAPALERELYVAELMAGVAERVADLAERLDALDQRVAKLERGAEAAK